LAERPVVNVADVPRGALEAVLLFDRGGDVIVQRNVGDASAFLESVDVENQEYARIYRLDGSVLLATVAEGESVQLSETGEHDPDGLRRRLSACGWGSAFMTNEQLIEAVIRIWDLQWKKSWPRWPMWLGGRPPDLW
jgi:hypothetical protein